MFEEERETKRYEKMSYGDILMKKHRQKRLKGE